MNFSIEEKGNYFYEKFYVKRKKMSRTDFAFSIDYV